MAQSMPKPKDIPAQEQAQHPGDESKMDPAPIYIRDYYKGAEKLKGKVALITGGDSGIGRSVAVHFAREGADVCICYYHADEDAAKTKKLVEAEGQQCHTIKGDQRSQEFCRKAVKECVSKLGSLNILVNNAAEQHMYKTLEEIPDGMFERHFETNIYGYYYFTRAALEHLQEEDCIINTCSVVAFRGSPTLVPYTSTKGAIVAFTRALSGNLADRKIRVNSVAPGPIWTPFIPSSFPASKVDDFGKEVPMKRPGQPAEVAPAYVFLASQDGSYVTGQTIHVNGGDIVGA